MDKRKLYWVWFVNSTINKFLENTLGAEGGWHSGGSQGPREVLILLNVFWVGRPRIYFVIKFRRMDKKNHLLGNLKRQVMALKVQLEKMQKTKQSKLSKQSYQSRNNHSMMSHSSRFESVGLDSSYLEKGIKKFPHHESNARNLTELIHQKSVIERVPTLSKKRRIENERTRENFSSDKQEVSRSRSVSPNPITGQGYLDRPRGLKTSYQPRREERRQTSNKKHFDIYY